MSNEGKMRPDIEEIKKRSEKASLRDGKIEPLVGKYYGTIVKFPRCEVSFWSDLNMTMPDDISEREIADHGSAQAVMDDHGGWNHCENKHDLADAEFVSQACTDITSLIAYIEELEAEFLKFDKKFSDYMSAHDPNNRVIINKTKPDSDPG